MTTHTVRLQSREAVAEGSMAFHFDKPAGFEFKPGQAIDLILAAASPSADGAESRHAFSIVSAPYQADLVVATRMRDSAFKRALGAMPIGHDASIDGPFGSLTLPKKQSRAAVLIAGGIGVTPYMSMLRQANHDRSQQELRLLCSNRRPEDAPFLAELQQLEQSNPHFRLLATMTDMARSSRAWDGLAQRIDVDLVRLAARNLPDPVFYLTGPPAMVEATRRILADAVVDEDDVRSEEFYGY